MWPLNINIPLLTYLFFCICLQSSFFFYFFLLVGVVRRTGISYHFFAKVSSFFSQDTYYYYAINFIGHIEKSVREKCFLNFYLQCVRIMRFCVF